jgi:hypothetical protein
MLAVLRQSFYTIQVECCIVKLFDSECNSFPLNLIQPHLPSLYSTSLHFSFLPPSSLQPSDLRPASNFHARMAATLLRYRP